MPDFNIETAWTCATNNYWEKPVKGSKGDLYVVHWGRLSEARIMETGAQHGWQCTCRGYQFRGTCRHISQVKDGGERCGWNSEMEPTAECAHDGDGEPCCPECGGSVRAMRVAV
jgi:hypothetical protein